MEIQKETDEHLWCLCPNHEDSNASFCINKADSGKYSKGYSYCFACGYSIQFSKEAVDIMSNKKSICRKKVPVNWMSLQSRYEIWDLETRKSVGLAAQWKVNGLENYGVGWDGECITAPMYNADSEITGIQRIWEDGKKGCVSGSQLGLFLPVSANTKMAITEGLSDAVVATHLGFFGLGKPSACFGEEIVRKYLENIKYEGDIIIVEDNDNAGRRSRVKLQMCLTSWNTRYVVPDSDLKQFYLDYGRNTTKRLLRM